MAAPINRAPANVDTEKLNAARVLAGTHNLAADRRFDDRVVDVVPAHEFVRMNPVILRRVWCVGIEAEVRQFFDLGSVVLTVGNVHEAAYAASADCRVVNVDVDASRLPLSELTLQRTEMATMIKADLRHPISVLSHSYLCDSNKPVVVLVCAVLHFIPDEDDSPEIIALYREALCPSRHMAVSYGAVDDFPVELGRAVLIPPIVCFEAVAVL